MTMIACITGAGRGIGRAIALAFAEKGAKLVLSARTESELGETAAQARKAGADTLLIPTDLADRRSLANLTQTALRELSHLDVLVNNAGYLKIAPYAETSLKDWDQTLAVNLTAPFWMTQQLLPLLQKSKRAHVFNVLSVAARMPFAGSSAYCASKAGLLGLNGVQREEFRSLGIRVTAVLPGATDTRMFDEIPGDYDRSKFVKPEDIGASILAAYRLSAGANVDEIQITTKIVI